MRISIPVCLSVALFLMVQVVAHAQLVTIRWAAYPVNADFDDTLMRAAEAFMETHPNIHVEIEFTSDLWDKLRVQYVADSAPDVVLLNFNWVPSAAENGILLDLLPYFERDNIGLDQFFPVASGDWMHDGHLYGGVFKWGGEMFAYNKDLFDFAGLGYIDESWNWDTFVESGRKLTQSRADGITSRWGVEIRDRSVHFTSATFIRSAGGDVLNEAGDESLLDSDDAHRGLDFMVALEQEYGIAVPYGTPSDQAHFNLGNVGMTFTGMWEAELFKQQDFRWGFGYPPAGPSRRNIQMGSGNAWGIVSSSEYPDEAWELVKWLILGPGQEYMGLLGIPGSRARALSSEYLENWEGYDVHVYLDTVSRWGHPYYGTIDWGEWLSAANVALQPVFSGEISVREGLLRAHEAVENVFARRELP